MILTYAESLHARLLFSHPVIHAVTRSLDLHVSSEEPADKSHITTSEGYL